MQRIPTLYGFSIVILVLVLMILNHFIYLGILERSLAGAETDPSPQAEQVEDVPLEDTAETELNGEEEEQEPEATTDESVEETSTDEETEEGN